MTAECQLDAVTPTDDGFLIVDCAVHGEVARVYTGNTVNHWTRRTDGRTELDLVSDAFEEHVRAVGGEPNA